MPPHQILVYDASGRDVSGAVGPLYEGDSLVLSCEVRGGKFKFVHLFLLSIFYEYDEHKPNTEPSVELATVNYVIFIMRI